MTEAVPPGVPVPEQGPIVVAPTLALSAERRRQAAKAHAAKAARQAAKAARRAEREADLTAAFLEANLDRLAEADDATLEAELGAHLAAAEAARIERKRAYFQKRRKEYLERVAKDPAKKAARLARIAAAMFYSYHREGPPKKRFAKPRELAAWDPVELRKYKEKLDAAYPDGIPSGKKTAHLREREAELEQLLARYQRRLAAL